MNSGLGGDRVGCERGSRGDGQGAARIDWMRVSRGGPGSAPWCIIMLQRLAKAGLPER